MTLGAKQASQKVLRKLHMGAPIGAIGSLRGVVALYGATDKGEHGYLGPYTRHLGPRRFRKNVVYEIGVGGVESRGAGGSLAIWRDYFVRSTIVGIDLHDKDIAWGDRVKFLQADQNDPAQLQIAVESYGRPDVVIDDGSHVGAHVLTSFETLWPQLNAGGVYIVEDLLTSYNPDYGGAEPVPQVSAIALIQQLVDEVQWADPTRQKWGGRTRPPRFEDLSAVHTYPGIAFFEKA
jgi:hypothetical protein